MVKKMKSYEKVKIPWGEDLVSFSALKNCANALANDWVLTFIPMKMTSKGVWIAILISFLGLS